MSLILEKMLEKITGEEKFKKSKECKGEFVINKLTNKTCGDGFNERVYKILDKGDGDCLHSELYKEKVPLKPCQYAEECDKGLDCKSNKCNNGLCDIELDCSETMLSGCGYDSCLALNDGLDKDLYYWENNECKANPCNENSYELCDEGGCNDLSYRFSYDTETNQCKEIINEQGESSTESTSMEDIYQQYEDEGGYDEICQHHEETTGSCEIGDDLQPTYYCYDGYENIDGGDIGSSGKCVECPEGTAGIDGSCTECPPNKVPNSNRTDCVMCPPGKIYNTIAPGCTPCPPGQKSNDNGSECISCKIFAGTHLDTATNSCVQCPDGKGPTSDASGCVDCEEGKVRVEGEGKCELCPAGESSEAGSSACDTCGDGKYSNESRICTTCEEGKIPNSDHTGCVCDAGKILNNDGRCDDCEAGTYLEVGDTECSPCSAGTYSGPAASECIDCELGQYSRDGASECINCPKGTFGDSSKRFCHRCFNSYKSGTDSRRLNSRNHIRNDYAYYTSRGAGATGSYDCDTACGNAGQIYSVANGTCYQPWESNIVNLPGHSDGGRIIGQGTLINGINANFRTYNSADLVLAQSEQNWSTLQNRLNTYCSRLGDVEDTQPESTVPGVTQYKSIWYNLQTGTPATYYNSLCKSTNSINYEIEYGGTQDWEEQIPPTKCNLSDVGDTCAGATPSPNPVQARGASCVISDPLSGAYGNWVEEQRGAATATADDQYRCVICSNPSNLQYINVGTNRQDLQNFCNHCCDQR